MAHSTVCSHFDTSGVSKEIDIYTIDRILRINKVYEPTNWEVQVCGGYYGQEIDDVILDDSVARKVEDQLDKAFDIISKAVDNRQEQIKYLMFNGVLRPFKDDPQYIELLRKMDLLKYLK